MRLGKKGSKSRLPKLVPSAAVDQALGWPGEVLVWPVWSRRCMVPDSGKCKKSRWIVWIYLIYHCFFSCSHCWFLRLLFLGFSPFVSLNQGGNSFESPAARCSDYARGPLLCSVMSPLTDLKVLMCGLTCFASRKMT